MAVIVGTQADYAIDTWQCPSCGARYYGNVSVTSPCQRCQVVELRRVGVWDLRVVAWPWLGLAG
jgi:uncharacterized OB-fold protein